MKEVKKLKKIGLYIHIPFCYKKCSYCDFISFKYNDQNIDQYVKALLKEIELYSSRLKKYKVKTLFIGGGTHSALTIDKMDTIVNKLYKSLSIESGIEFSVESNPGTLTKEKLEGYLKIGVNRLSIGLQSFNDRILNSIGRIHSKEIFLRNYHTARDVGFDNINIDLMYGLPGQSLSDWKDTLEKVIELRPEHISAYALKIEEGTRFYDLYLQNKLHLADEEEEREMYHYTIETLNKQGIVQYEISNFAKEDYECEHNLIYWNNEEFLGLGLAAHSYLNFCRFANTNNFEEYINLLNNGKLPVSTKENKSREDEIFETMFLGLRLTKGVNVNKFKKRFRLNPLEIYKYKLDKMIKLGLITVDENSIRLTRYGMDVSNQVFLEFIPE
jgi:oxygen-independent coproporphyrinogen-3 oxidase